MIGQTISHYRVIERLGEGGMGVVYLAEDTLLGRRVAIKTLTNSAGPVNQHFRTRFLREARAVSALSHPHIATIQTTAKRTKANRISSWNLSRAKRLVNSCYAKR
jgi:serine/threonine protein kinase